MFLFPTCQQFASKLTCSLAFYYTGDFFLCVLFLTSLLEYNCFTMVCQFLLYNKVNQLYVYIYPHISSLLRLPPTLAIPPLQVVTKHRGDLPVLCGCFPLAIYFTFGSEYMSMPLSHFVQGMFFKNSADISDHKESYHYSHFIFREIRQMKKLKEMHNFTVDLGTEHWGH